MPFSLLTGIKPWQPLANERGVTLIEMMVYMVIAGMLLATSVMAFLGQNKSYNRQDVIAEIQQNIRGATNAMVSDVRFAGLGLADSSDVAFSLADPSTLGINYWADPDDYWSAIDDYWDADLLDEKVTVYYRLSGTDLQRGFAEIGTGIGTVPNWTTLAENIVALRFEYLLNNDPDTAEGAWVWDGDIDPDTDENLEKIRAVKIMMVGSAREAAFNPTDSMIYEFPLDELGESFTYTPPAGTGYKRMMSVMAQARNNRD